MKLHKLYFALLMTISLPTFAQEVVVIGDSLSDIGQKNWNLKASYLNTQKQANLLYDEYVAQALGSSLKASSKGGSDYAYSGGVVVGDNSPDLAKNPNLALDTQVNEYLKQGVNPDALHIVWGGGNDMSAILANAQKAPNATASVIQNTSLAAAQSAKQWAKLRANGVNFAVMPNVPNVVYTPDLFNAFAESFATGMAMQVKQIAPGKEDLVKKAFNQAFQRASRKILMQDSHSLADFNALRQQVLKETVAGIYQSPLGSALQKANINQADLSKQVLDKYQEFSASATAATQQLNRATSSALNQAGGNVLRLDVDQLFSDILSNPQTYGFRNTTASVCEQSSAHTLCSAKSNDDDQLLFADGFHPGPKAHKIMSDYLLSTLEAPRQMSALRRLAQESGKIAWDFARQENSQENALSAANRTVQAIGAYQGDISHDKNHTLHLGALAKLTPNWQAGIIFSHQDQDTNHSKTAINAKTNSMSSTIQYNTQNWWLGAMVQLNDSNYHTNRHIQLGKASINQIGETSGNSFGLGLFGAYQWHINQMNIAALGDLIHTYGKVDSFSEQSGGATQMFFGKQTFHSLRSGLGVKWDYDLNEWRPYAALRWVKEWHKGDNTTQATLNGSSFALATDSADRSWVNSQIGIQWQKAHSPLRIFASIERDFAHQNHNNTALQLGMSARF